MSASTSPPSVTVTSESAQATVTDSADPSRSRVDVPERSADVYIAPDGNDTAVGLADTPVATLERALEVVPLDGIVEFTDGIHHLGYTLFEVSDVTIRGADGAVVDGGNLQPFGIFCDGCSNVVIENLAVTSFTDIGVGFTNSSGVVLRGLSVYGNGVDAQNVGWELEGYGIHVDLSINVTIRGNDVFDNGPEPGRDPVAILGTGINTYGNQDMTIEGNHSHNNRGAGIVVEDSFRVVVSDNVVESNDLDATAEGWWDGALWVDGGGDILVTGNIFTGNQGPGIQISDEEGQSPRGYVLTDNVSTGNVIGLLVWGFGGVGLPSTDILLLVDNEIANNLETDTWVEPDL
jgi:parallel beta-helix repeat protein